MILRRSSLLSALLGLVLVGCFASQYRSRPRVAVVEGDPIVQMRPLGSFPSAAQPPMVAMGEHSDPPKGKERVLGLPTPRPPRAYPLGLLDRFEVVNDSVEEAPIVIVRCALTHVAAIYGRRAGDRIMTFESSGALWRDTLVLRDRETGTLWSAATGAALVGPLAGERLPAIPAIYATAQAWQSAFPRSIYMDLGKPTSVPLLMRLYGASPWQGVSGSKTRDDRHKPKKEFLSVHQKEEVLAFTEDEVREARLIRATLGGESLSIEWDSTVKAPRAYSLPEEGRRERPVVPMYWFALDRHFETVRTIPDDSPVREATGRPE